MFLLWLWYMMPWIGAVVMARCAGVGCLGGLTSLGRAIVVLPPSGRAENANKAAAAGAPRQAEQADHPPPTRSSRRRSTCARTSHTARAPRGSRAAARGTPASGKRSKRNPPPQQQARPLLARCALRALRVCAARRAQRRRGRLGVLRACASLSMHVRPGAGRRTRHRDPPPTSPPPPACVRADLPA